MTVRFNTADGTAKAGSDYSARVGSLTFAPGEKTKTITVTVLDDAAAESVEEFSVVLGDPVNATITKARGVATIEASDRSLDPPTIVTPGTTPPTGTPQNQPNTTTKQLVPRMILGPRTVIGRRQRAREDAGHLPEGLADRVRRLRRASTRCQAAAEARQEDVLGQEGNQGLRVDQALACSRSILRKSKTMRVKVIVLVKTNTKTIKASPGTITLKATTGADQVEAEGAGADDEGRRRSVEDRPAPPLQFRGRSPVAQLAEHSAVNRRVVGSSPTRGAHQPCARQTVPVMVWVNWPLARSSTPTKVSIPLAPANVPVPCTT